VELDLGFCLLGYFLFLKHFKNLVLNTSHSAMIGVALFKADIHEEHVTNSNCSLLAVVYRLHKLQMRTVTSL
jgi:hypothetical protein